MELPLPYQVGSNTLLLFCECCGLLRSPYIEEVGTRGEYSTSIRITFDLPAGVMVTQVLLAGGVSGTTTGATGGSPSLPSDILQLINGAVATANAASKRALESAERADKAVENMGVPITLSEAQ